MPTARSSLTARRLRLLTFTSFKKRWKPCRTNRAADDRRAGNLPGPFFCLYRWLAQNASLDGELCGVLPDGRTAFNLIQNATDTGEGSLVFFLFDLLHLDGENLTALPLIDRKTRLASLLDGAPESLRYNDHQIGHGAAFHRL